MTNVAYAWAKVIEKVGEARMYSVACEVRSQRSVMERE